MLNSQQICMTLIEPVETLCVASAMTPVHSCAQCLHLATNDLSQDKAGNSREPLCCDAFLAVYCLYHQGLMLAYEYTV